MTAASHADTPLEQPCATICSRQLFTIGLPLCEDAAERRFPITPEGAAMLVEQGFRIKMQSGAAASIHYTDSQYMAAGVEITDRTAALGADIVIHLAPLPERDVARLRRGAMLLTLLAPSRQSKATVRALLQRNVMAIAIDLIADAHGNRPFADILAEIDGRAAIARASALLADARHGKGILLGGVAGVIPCEVTVIGSDIGACAAARSAAGTGALVRMFDHDVYRLRRANREFGASVVTSALHPRVLENALRSADVVIYTDVNPTPAFSADTIALMKRGVVIFDLTPDSPGSAFPSLPTVDLALASPLDFAPDRTTRACYINAGSSVPRTAAMAMSNTFVTMMRQIVDCEGAANALKLLPGFQAAAYTFMGRPVNARIAEIAGCRCADIKIFLTLS